MKYIKNCLLFLLVGLFLLAAPVSKAQQVDLSISPPLIEVVAKPGKTLLIAYTIRNGGDPMIIRSAVLPFKPQGNRGNIILGDEYEGPIQFLLDNADLQLNEPFFLRSNGQQQLLLRIRVPEGAPEGDYYYTFLAESDAPPGLDGTSSARAKVSIGSNIIITITGTGQLEAKGRITLFDVLSTRTLSFLHHTLHIFDSGEPVPVVLQIANMGKNFVKSSGNITLRGNFGETAQYAILDQNILSESQRILTATPSAQIDTRQPASLILSGFFVGNYKLSTVVNFGEGTPNLYASTSFIALPFKIIGGLILTILVIGVLLYRKSNSKDNPIN